MKGIWTAVSGAAAQAQRTEAIANNLANANTIGFKKDAPTFKEYLAGAEREPEAKDIAKAKDLSRLIEPGDGKAMVVVDGTYTDFRQGNLSVTNSSLDLALSGPGFLEVNTPSGIRYTRNGHLKIAADGKLVTSEGYAVLSDSGGAAELGVANRFINLREAAGSVSITEAGEVIVGDAVIAKLAIREFAEPQLVKKSGSGLYENTSVGNLKRDGFQTVVVQGVLENSNVNPIQEMAELIKAHRLFEQNMNVMKSISELPGSDIGKI